MSYPQQPGGWSDPSWPAQQGQAQPAYNPYDAPQSVSGQPAGGQPVSPQSAAPYGGYGYTPYQAASPSTNGLAVASLVCSLVGFATCITAPVGAVLGHIARKQIRQTGEAGDGMALAGIIVGWILTGLFLLLIVGYIVIIVFAISASSTSNPGGGFDDLLRSFSPVG